MSFNRFFVFRYLAIISVIASLIGSALMFFVGAIKTYLAIGYVLEGGLFTATENFHQHLSSSSQMAVATLVSAVDVFLFALVLLIFSYGVYHLFIINKEQEANLKLPEWARVTSLAELKMILAEVIIVILFVEFLESVMNIKSEWLPWEGVILPFAILLMAAAVKFMH